jgi:hypothetical protein
MPRRSGKVPEPDAVVAAVGKEPARVGRNDNKPGVVDPCFLAGPGVDRPDGVHRFILVVAADCKAAAIGGEAPRIGLGSSADLPIDDASARCLHDNTEVGLAIVSRRDDQRDEITAGREDGQLNGPDRGINLPLAPLLQVHAANARGVGLVPLHQGDEVTAFVAVPIAMERFFAG